jgi:hypothetical protein
MPSVHVAWAAIIGVTIFLLVSTAWRWLGPAHFAATLLVVVATGNHYWLDGVVGVAIAALALVFDLRVRAAVTRLRKPAPVPALSREAAPSARGSAA